MQTKIGYNYKFDESACATCGGLCCIGESGAIWISAQEAREIAKFLDLDYDIFCDNYTKRIDGRLSLKEKPYKDGWACIFYENGCTIYKVRPTQCITFPFWDVFLEDKHCLSCPGVRF